MSPLDVETRKHTAFKSFLELVEDAMRNGYQPTLLGPETDRLAVAFNAAMQRLGCVVRAWRGTGEVRS